VTRNFTIHASCPKRSAEFPRPQIRRSDSRQWAHSSDHPLTPFGSPSIECRNIAPELNDDIEIIGRRLRLNHLAHVHSPTPMGLEAAIHLALEDLHRERQEGLLWRKRPRPIPVDESPVS
jgi:hypothetical protein